MRNRYFIFFSILLLNIFFENIVNAQHVTILQQTKSTNIRGLSVVNNKVAWVSGSKGYIAHTIDGGKTWTWQQIKGFEKADFRDIEAFSAKKAIIISSGTPALILKTNNGGINWVVKYRNADTSYFLDAMDFADNNHGMIMGDPINNKWIILETNDKGEHWHLFKNLPVAQLGEAAFAASGTCLRMSKKRIGFVSGGSVARYFAYSFSDSIWNIQYLPIAQGKTSQGTFSFANDQVFVGGDYANDKSIDRVACWYNPGTISIKPGYQPSEKKPAGFQSCVELINNYQYLSTGTSGSNISTDLGKTWIKIDDISYNVCRKAKHGKLVLLAGIDGKIAVFKP